MAPKRRGGPPKRVPKKTSIKYEILVFAEGTVTEDQYLVHLRRKHRDRVTVTVGDTHGVPLTLVRAAKQAKKEAHREERRGRGRAPDEIWCMYDVDIHPYLAEARTMAEDDDIELAISNPCIELWFVLHFEDQTGFIERDRAQARAQELLGCDKALSTEALEKLDESFEQARSRAQALDEKHAGDGSSPGANPSSQVWRLVDAIRHA